MVTHIAEKTSIGYRLVNIHTMRYIYLRLTEKDNAEQIKGPPHRRETSIGYSLLHIHIMRYIAHMNKVDHYKLPRLHLKYFGLTIDNFGDI